MKASAAQMSAIYENAKYLKPQYIHIDKQSHI